LLTPFQISRWEKYRSTGEVASPFEDVADNFRYVSVPLNKLRTAMAGFEVHGEAGRAAEWQWIRNVHQLPGHAQVIIKYIRDGQADSAWDGAEAVGVTLEEDFIGQSAGDPNGASKTLENFLCYLNRGDYLAEVLEADHAARGGSLTYSLEHMSKDDVHVPKKDNENWRLDGQKLVPYPRNT
jgi:hypothetical protein